jgi:hypothetical protein
MEKFAFICDLKAFLKRKLIMMTTIGYHPHSHHFATSNLPWSGSEIQITHTKENDTSSIMKIDTILNLHDEEMSNNYSPLQLIGINSSRYSSISDGALKQVHDSFRRMIYMRSSGTKEAVKKYGVIFIL